MVAAGSITWCWPAASCSVVWELHWAIAEGGGGGGGGGETGLLVQPASATPANTPPINNRVTPIATPQEPRNVLEYNTF